MKTVLCVCLIGATLIGSSSRQACGDEHVGVGVKPSEGAEVLFDGGVQRGTDVGKALSLGASAVGVGKMLGWALAAAGEAGLKRMLELMDVEIRTAMGLMGVTSIKQLNPAWLRPTQPVRAASQTNTYPWYERQLRK